MNELRVSTFILGAVVAGCVAVAGFFLRYWRDSQDRFFLFVSASFLVEGISRTFLAMTNTAQEGGGWIYLLRTIAYGLIVVAVYDKNRKRGRTT